jgi:hypothetical protein
MFNKLKTLVPVAVGVAAAGVLAFAAPAHAATPGCTAVPLTGCVSLNTEVPNLPDLDVQGGGATVGNVLIVYTRTSHDKAEDFMVQDVNPGLTNISTQGPPTSPVHSVRIRYAPNGVPSTLCLSSVNPDGHAAVQLRLCDTNPATFNPWQTFTSAAATGDFTAVQFTENIGGNVLTDPANNGSIGVKGARIQVRFEANVHHTGQFWSANGA